MRRTATLVFSVLAVAGCTEDGPPLVTEPVVESLDGLVGDFGTGTTELASCPIDRFAGVIDDTLANVDDPVVRDALDGAPSVVLDGATGPVLSCSLTGDAAASTGIVVRAAPAELERFAAEVAGAGATVDVDESVLHRGGRFHRICVEYDTEPERNYCEVDWLDERVLIGVYVRGPEAERVDTDEIEEQYRYLVPIIVDRLTEYGSVR